MSQKFVVILDQCQRIEGKVTKVVGPYETIQEALDQRWRGTVETMWVLEPQEEPDHVD